MSFGGIFIKLLCEASKFVFLENVDRLLKSPTNVGGRDFAIILNSTELGYIVEWKVINAADYERYATKEERKGIYYETS